MDAEAKLPIRWLVLGIAIAVVPATIAQAVAMAGIPYAGPGLEYAPRLWVWMLSCAAPMALLIGVPIAIWALRDPARNWIAWGLAGAVAGMTGAVVLCVVLAVTTRLTDLIGHFFVIGIVVAAFGVSGGVATALLARPIAWWLARRAR